MENRENLVRSRLVGKHCARWRKKTSGTCGGSNLAFLEISVADEARFLEIPTRHGLLEAWASFKSHYLSNP
jgi:hypothetical protein